jgi:hypothetical protein
MEKNILSEIDQMKYLFGYKPGKVISEQATPPVQTGVAKTAPAKGGATKTPQTGKPQQPQGPQQIMTVVNGRNVPVKLPLIKDENILNNFTAVGNEQIRDAGLPIIDKWCTSSTDAFLKAKQAYLDNPMYQNSANREEGSYNAGQDVIKGSYCHKMMQMMMAILNMSAAWSWNGDAFAKFGIDSLLDYLDGWTDKAYFKDREPSDLLKNFWFKNNVVTQQQFLTVVKNIVDNKIKSIGGDPTAVVPSKTITS